MLGEELRLSWSMSLGSLLSSSLMLRPSELSPSPSPSPSHSEGESGRLNSWDREAGLHTQTQQTIGWSTCTEARATHSPASWTSWRWPSRAPLCLRLLSLAGVWHSSSVREPPPSSSVERRHQTLSHISQATAVLARDTRRDLLHLAWLLHGLRLAIRAVCAGGAGRGASAGAQVLIGGRGSAIRAGCLLLTTTT